jgi:hypothetical protein
VLAATLLVRAFADSVISGRVVHDVDSHMPVAQLSKCISCSSVLHTAQLLCMLFRRKQPSTSSENSM